MTERDGSSQQQTEIQTKGLFISSRERPVAPGLLDFNDDRPVAIKVRAGGDPQLRIVPERYPARG
jgi:hypothetical protein